VQKRTKFEVRSDASKQRWVRDDRKEAFWRSHIHGWKQSGQSKRAYCIAHNVSQSSFNAWTREIGIRDREKVPSANAEALLSESVEQLKNPFVALHLLPDGALEEEGAAESSESPASSTARRVEILVPGGATIRIESCSLNFIGELFSTLKGQKQC